MLEKQKIVDAEMEKVLSEIQPFECDGKSYDEIK